ncbi:MAG: hypothetical protein ACKVY0_10825 [Prosthecobacter sp.]|uniref:hypothetical protein n=1 Tax=Prosthecobacter sp. TaxID=1965333 RepID=UPI003900F72D
MNAFRYLKIPAMIALLSAASFTTPCSGAVILTFSQVGSDVVGAYVGSINTSGLDYQGDGSVISSFINPGYGIVSSQGSSPSSSIYIAYADLYGDDVSTGASPE